MKTVIAKKKKEKKKSLVKKGRDFFYGINKKIKKKN